MKKQYQWVYYFISAVLMFAFLSLLYLIIEIIPLHYETIYKSVILFIFFLAMFFVLNPLKNYIQNIINLLFKKYNIDDNYFLEKIAHVFIQENEAKNRLAGFVASIKHLLKLQIKCIYQRSYNGFIYEAVFQSTRKYPQFIKTREIITLPVSDLILPVPAQQPLFVFIIEQRSVKVDLQHYFSLIQRLLTDYYHSLSLSMETLDQLSLQKFKNISGDIVPLIHDTVKKIQLVIKKLGTQAEYQGLKKIDFTSLILRFNSYMEKLK